MIPVNRIVMGLLLFCFHLGVENNLAKAQTGLPIEGRVVYPDGSAAGGAYVIVESVCADTSAHLAWETTANPNGEFSIKSFDPTCNRYKFSASQREAFWLPTGDDIFYLEPNGTTPTIELAPGQKSSPLLIHLAQRGGEIELKVFDEKTRAYIYAGLSIDREPVGNKTFGGGASIATGDDGSAYTLFLPPGNYIATVDSYLCHGKTYFSARPPTFTFSIKAGVRQARILKVNIAEIRAAPSYDNPAAIRCSR